MCTLAKNDKELEVAKEVEKLIFYYWIISVN